MMSLSVRTLVFSVFTILSTPALATYTCSDIFTISDVAPALSTDESFAAIENLESKYQELESQVLATMAIHSKDPSKTEELSRKLSIVQSRIEKLSELALSEMPLQRKDFDVIEQAMRALTADVKDVKNFENGKTVVASKTESTLAELLENISSIQADIPYTYETLQGYKLSAKFSDKIVAEMSKRDPRFSENVERALRQLEKGIFGGSYKGVGVIRMENLEIFEVRTVGGREHKLRLMGYIHQNTLYFVAWTINEHTAGETSRMAAIIHRIRAANGH